MIRIHDELMTRGYLKPMVENARTDFPQELLFELNRKRGELVELEASVSSISMTKVLMWSAYGIVRCTLPV